jgi:hypothetical protein
LIDCVIDCFGSSIKMVCHPCRLWCDRPLWVELRNGQWICLRLGCARHLIAELLAAVSRNALLWPEADARDH